MTADEKNRSSTNAQPQGEATGTRPDDAKSSQPAQQGGSGGWRGGNRNRRGYRGRNGGNNRNTTSTGTKFKGSCPELEGHVFDIGANQATQFTKTQKEVGAYASRKYGAEVGRAIETLQDQKEYITIPKDPPLQPGQTEYTMTQLEIIKSQARQYTIKCGKYAQGLRDMYNTVKNQCTDTMKQVLLGQPEYDEADRTYDTLAFMAMLQRVAYNHRAEQFPPYAALMAMKSLFLTRQPDEMSNAEWYEQYKNLIIAAEACGGSFNLPGVDNYVRERKYPGIAAESLTDEQNDQVKSAGRELSVSTLYIINSNKQRYGSLRQDLENDYLKGHSNYPEEMGEAQKLLINYKGLSRNNQHNNHSNRRNHGSNDGVAFAQSGQSSKSEARCWKCNKKGHFAYEGKCKPEDIAAFEKLKEQHSSGQGQSHAQAETRDAPPTEEIQQFNYTNMEPDSYDELDPPYGSLFCQPCTIIQDDQPPSIQDEDGDAETKPSVSYAHILSQSRGKQINKDWLLLDNQSTVHVICNRSMLANVRKIDKSMYIHCNAGVASTNLVGELNGVGVVWYHPEGIANIISLSRIKRTNRVTFDSHGDNIFKMYNREGTTFRPFRESDRGLYYSDLRDDAISLNIIDTVDNNKSKFSALDRKRADRARELQDTLNVTTKEMLSIIDNNHLPNCPVTRDDIKVAELIHGPSLVGLKGKTVRRSEEHVRVKISPLPPIMEKYLRVSLSADIMFVNGVRFFLTIARHLQFATCEMIGNAKIATIVSSVGQVTKIYSKRGFTVDNINMDIQFEPARTELESLKLNTNFVSRDEHVPEIERFIRTVKERVRGIQCTLPFKRYPARLTAELVMTQIFYWNALPKSTGVSPSLSPRAIVTGLQINYAHCQLRFGKYVQTHEETNNDTGKERTTGAIALRPSGNQQGGYRFYSLTTGKVIRRNRWTALPMPNEVVDRVHKLSRRKEEGIQFLDRNQQPFEEANGDREYESDDDSTYCPDDEESDDGYDSQSVQSTAPAPSDNDEVPPGDSTGVENTIGSTGVDDTGGSTGVRENEQPPVQRTLRPNRGRSYRHLKTVGYLNHTSGRLQAGRLRVIPTLKAYAHALTALSTFNSAEDPVLWCVDEVILTQYNMKRGIKLFRERGIAAVKKELQQMNDRAVVKPVSPQLLTKEQRARALAYLMFLKEKRCGTIKGRGCADGRKQRDWMDSDETASPTVSTAALFLSCMIDAYERRDVATTDIPGAFLQTPDKSKERTHLRFEGVMVDQLVEIDPVKYGPHVHVDKNGRKYMYAECLKAIYGTLNAALLFWQLLSSDLRQWGFVVNPYDSCVMNKMINGKQCTILWHVDDLKISHVDPTVVSMVLKKINDKYGRETPITTTRGKEHDYLGMLIDYSGGGKVQFMMTDYIYELLDELPAELRSGEAATPAADHLFSVSENGVQLNGEKSTLFHKITAKLLFLSKRARPDIQLAVAFLCTRVKSPDEDDWKKLHRLIKYLRATPGLPLVLSMDGSNTMRWYVDAAFAVHKNMRSHTGMMLTMGQGAALSGSRKQKINTRSSTEAELVGVDEELSMILWSRYFLLAQGYDIKDNILYQDNQASMKLEKNGRKSSGKRTKHIDIRYFYVADKVKGGEISIEYCPTGDMIADYFTKPLQGSQFRSFRNTILGVSETDIPSFNKQAAARRSQKLQALKVNEQQDGLAKPPNTRDG